MMDDGILGRVLVVVGTRPEAIKMAPVVHALEDRRGRVETRLALTGQHDELVDEALATFRLEPDWDLGIMREGQSLTEVGKECLGGVSRVLEEWRPDIVLVQGDTASVFFGTLAAYLHQIPAGHVEAGLRTGDLKCPFPEEGFRRLAGVLADLHFAPTPGARENLLREGVSDERIHVTGNTVVDALLAVADQGRDLESPVLRRLVDPDGPPFVLLTAHRRESFGPPLERVFNAVLELVRQEEKLEVAYPVHPNPEVTGPARRILGDHPRIHLLAPLAYPDLVAALAAATCVLTDSGGIQEEAPTFGTPVLVLREMSERPEGIEAGVARLVGTDPDRIVEGARALIGRTPDERRRTRSANPYGDGRAGQRIAGLVEAFLTAEPQETKV